MKICRFECEKLINKLVDKHGLTNFYSAIYGSSAIFGTNRLSEGDLDLVVVSADLQQDGFEPIIRESIGDYHIYLISDEIFRDDMKTLAYGGYYCHKFALSFKPLIQVMGDVRAESA